MTNANLANFNPQNGGTIRETQLPQYPAQPIPIKPGVLPVLFFLAALYYLDPSDAATEQYDGAERAMDEFWLQVETSLTALGVNLPSDQRKLLDFWYARPYKQIDAQALVQQGAMQVAHSWESYRAKFPKLYQNDYTKFMELRVKAFKGEFGPVYQAREVALRVSPPAAEAPQFGQPMM